MNTVIPIVSKKWIDYSMSLPFKEGVPLKEKITLFTFPAFEGMRSNFPQLKNSPDTALFLLVLKGIIRSGSHTKAEIESEFNITIPE